MAMTEFEKASLALQQAQIDAMNANTAELARHAPPDAKAQVAAQEARLDVIRHGAAPIPESIHTGRAFAIDGSTGKAKGTGDPILPDGVPCEIRIRHRADGVSDVLEVGIPDEASALVCRFYESQYDAEHPDDLREASTSATRLADYVDRRTREVSIRFGLRFRIPLIRAIVGKDVRKLGRLVEWNDPAPECLRAAAAE